MRVGRTAFLQDAGLLLAAGEGLAGLGGDALAFVLSQVAGTGRWLVVVDDEDRAQRVLDGLRFFHPSPGRVEAFPGDDNRPYDGFSPDPGLPRQRLKTLERVDRGGDLVVVATVRALMQRVPDRETRALGTRTVVPGGALDRDDLVGWLADAGYLATTRADEAGRFAVRGDIVDVWPASARAPVRIDFFDDEVERLRRLDPTTLRPARKATRITLLPAREERLDGAALDRALDELARLVTAQGQGTARRRHVVEELRAGVRFSALPDWLPALVSTVAPLEALAGLRTVVVMPGDVAAAARDFEGTARRRFDQLEVDERPLVPPEERYVPSAAVLDGLQGSATVHDLPTDRAPDLGARPTDELAVRGSDLAPVVSRLQRMAADDVRVGLVVENGARAEHLMQMLEPHGLRPEAADRPDQIRRGKVSLLVGHLPRGFVAQPSGWAFVPVSALFGGTRRRSTERAHALFEAGVTSMAQLKQGDPVVHRVHGVGLYRGMRRLDLQRGVQQDFVQLEYKGGDSMFLPVASLGLLSRYTPASSDAKVTLDRLGGQTWTRRKGRVRDNLLSMAQDLLEVAARRELATRRPYDPIGPRFRAFEARFPHEETPDQAEAINAVLRDLEQPFPMDRLVCGDVGFGKTEVAMRAAMRVVECGRQVAVLCPTTVLAYQHHQSFAERFASDPDVQVGMLSRFVSTAEERRVHAELATGEMHIVVGTTALLGRQIQYDDLGLVVVDEEHRFGVRQKDRLKRMRSEVDVLALSATPIPRTLQMALSGMREMSMIGTPPASRLAVRTSAAKMSETRVRDALLTEMERGGQAYVVHNRVETIGPLAKRLRAWVPEARFAVAHGQMKDGALERVLIDFIAGKYDVLVCTAIVESGVDLPNVNTMLIDRADQFGLAQLYQLRGRVGRSDRRATCLLLVPEHIPADARKRLRVIVENQRLGSGFHIASADLELRGGGNLLGSAQSGNIDQVGYETWVELLGEAVHSARGDLERERIEVEVEVPVDAFLPDDLVRDPQVRLGWYKRLAEAPTPTSIDGLIDDLEGEFGDISEPARNLADLMATRLICRELGITRCHWLRVRALLQLHPSSVLDEVRLERLMERHPKRFEVSGADPISISVRFTPREGEKPFRYLRWVFAQLQQTGSAS